MELLREEAKKIGINLSDDQVNKFSIYMDYLLEYNSHTNLTSIKNPEDVIIKHFLDSISIEKFLNIKENSKVADIGTGAGFPGVPLKICSPKINLTLIDSLNKRITFLKNLISKLDIEADIFHARAEELGNNSKFREKFDLVVSRAVAPLNILCEYCLPYVKVGGCFVALKGPIILEELKNSENAISSLGGNLESEFSFELPFEKGKRTILIVRKSKNTPKVYPRKNSKISSNPL